MSRLYNRRRGFLFKTAVIATMLMFILPGISAMESDPSVRLTMDDGGETFIVFKDATKADFDAVVDTIFEEGGQTFAMNPPNAMRTDLPPGVGSTINAMPGVSLVETKKVDNDQFKEMNRDTQMAARAWNLHVREVNAGYSVDTMDIEGPMPKTFVSDMSSEEVHAHGSFNEIMSEMKDDVVACNEDLYCTDDMKEVEAIMEARQKANRPMGPMTPAPGPSDTSEYMMGSIGVAIIFPESNGSVDTSSEDWTGAEETNVINEINNAFNWWTNRINGEGLTVTTTWSYTPYYKQATSYEPITRNSFSGAANQNMWTWMNEIQGDLGFNNGIGGARALANYTRGQLGTDWAYIIWVADSSADADNYFLDNKFGFALLGGPYVVMTYGNNGYGIGGMDAVTAHESGHIFYALDEYASANTPSGARSGYLNVINGNSQTVGNPPPITNVACIMRGGSSPFNNNQICGFTKGQVGFNDTDGDNIPDVLDTFPKSTIDTMTNGVINATSYTYYGNSTVNPLNNNNPNGWGNDVTINKISTTEWRIDSGGWTTAIALDGAFSNVTEAWKFDLAGLSDGTHTVEVRTRNDQNNWEGAPYVKDTFLVDLTSPTSQVGPLPQYISSPSFAVNWTGDDGSGSGLDSVELWYKKGNGPYQKYLASFTTTPIVFIHSGDAKYEFYTIGKDNASNWEAPPAIADASTTVEATPPNSTLDALPQFTNQTEFDIEYTAEDLGVGIEDVEIFFRKDNGVWSSLGSITASPYHFISSGDGVYDFYIIARDTLGNTEDKPQLPEVTTIVDTIPPTVTALLVGVNGDNGWYTTGVTVTFSTFEPAGHLDTIYYRLNNGTWTDYVNTFTVPGDGHMDVEFYGVDKAMNYGTPDNVYLDIDTTPPRGSLTIDNGNRSTNDPTVDVDLTYSENVSLVTDMMVSEDPSFSDVSWITPSKHITFDLTSHAGIKTLYTKFKNGAGLESVPVEATIILDSSGPTIRISKPADGAQLAVYSFTATGTAKDNVGIDLVELSINGGTAWVRANGTTDWDLIVSVPTDGHYTLMARTFDLVGNMAEESINITVDARLPEVEIDTPKSNSVSESKTIPIEGRTDPDAVLKVNGAGVTVNDDGTFSTMVSLRDGTNEIILTIQKPAGTITKKIRVIYVHPPIIISDLKHDPPEPKREDVVTISCVVPGNHIASVNLKWKLFGSSEETLEMVRGEGDLYTAQIGPFKDGGTIQYHVLAADDTGEDARYPEKGKKEFFIPRPDIGGEEPPEPQESENSWVAWVFLLIIFAIAAIAIGLSMRAPRPPPGVGPRRISNRTMAERIDPEKEDGGSGFRDRGVNRARPRMQESERFESRNGGSSRFREDDI